jgi:hypothetical protein
MQYDDGKLGWPDELIYTALFGLNISYLAGDVSLPAK